MKRALSQRGFVALISAVLISAVLIPLAIAAGTSGLFARLDALGIVDETAARTLARSCVEVALLALATSTDPGAYAPQGQVVAVDGRGSCTIASITHSGTDATIDAHAEAHDSYASVSTNVSLGPPITVISWNGI